MTSLLTYVPPRPRWKCFQKRYALFGVLSISIVCLYAKNVTLWKKVDLISQVMEAQEEVNSTSQVSGEHLMSYLLNFLKKPILEALKSNQEVLLNDTTISTNLSVSSSEMVNGTAERKLQSTGYKTVVFYTNFFGGSWKDFLRNNRTDLAHHECLVHRCVFSFDRDKASSADAVIFHWTDFNRKNVPKVRHPHQRYIWMDVEAPGTFYQNSTKPKPKPTQKYGFFNWTATYHRESDIRAPYGVLHPKEGGTLPDPLYPLDLKSPTHQKYVKFLTEKTQLIRDANGTLGLEDLLAMLRDGNSKVSANRMLRRDENSSSNSTRLQDLYLNGSFYARPKLVAWMVSHCYTLSGREVYIHELKKHIAVDIYGRCSTLRCGRNHLDTFCYTDLFQPNYKFYLSFENNWCLDYMTEKVFLPLKYGLIPVVWGGTKYEEMLPPHSYVDATKFTPKELAAELKRIASSDVEYATYHIWRNYWKVTIPAPYCDICSKLHNDVTETSIPDLGQWWHEVNKCITRYPEKDYPRTKFSGVYKYVKNIG